MVVYTREYPGIAGTVRWLCRLDNIWCEHVVASVPNRVNTTQCWAWLARPATRAVRMSFQ